MGEEGKKGEKAPGNPKSAEAEAEQWVGNNKLLWVAVVQAPGCYDSCPDL